MSSTIVMAGDVGTEGHRSVNPPQYASI